MRSAVWWLILAIIFVSVKKAAADPSRESPHHVIVIEEYQSQRGRPSKSRHHEPKSSNHESYSFNQKLESSRSNDHNQTISQNDDSQHQNKSVKENHSQNGKKQNPTRNQENYQSQTTQNQNDKSSASYTPEGLSSKQPISSKEDSSLPSETSARQELSDGHRHMDVHEYRDSHREHHEFDELDLDGFSREEKEEVRDEDIEEMTADMYYVLGVKSLREASDAMYQLTGYRKEAEAIQYVMDITGIKTKDQAYIFLRKVRGSRSSRFVIEFMDSLQGTSNIKVIVDLLKELTNKQDVFKAFKILRMLTGHADFDGIYESLQKMSGEKYLHEVCDYFKHKSNNHVDGLAGVRKEVYDITGGIGPAEFPRIMKVLLPEVDMNGAFNLLILATRTGDLGEAIREFVKIMRTKTIAEAVQLLKKVTNQTQFKYALEELTQATNRGSIKVIIYSLYKIAGKGNMKEVQQVFNEVFESDNIVTVIHKVNKVSKLQEPLYFLLSLLDVTRCNNVRAAGDVIKGLTVKKLSVLDILEQIRIKSGHEDILNFFRKLIVFTGARSVQQAWEALKSVIFIPDIFFFFETVSKYTDVDVIAFMETILRITNSSNIGVAAAMLCKISNKKNFFDVVRSISEITGIDVVRLFELIITISKRFFFEEVVVVIEEYTNTTNFIDALADLKRATGQQDIISAIEYIKANKPRIERSISSTTTTKATTTLIEKPISTEETIITTEKPNTTTVVFPSNAESTKESSSSETPITKATEEPTAISTEEPITTIKPTTTQKPTTTITAEPTTTTITDDPTTTKTDTTESTGDTSEITSFTETTTDHVEGTTQKQIPDKIDQNKSFKTTNNAKKTIITIKQNKDGTFSLVPTEDDSSDSTENSTDQMSVRKPEKDQGVPEQIIFETSGQTTTELVAIEVSQTQHSSVQEVQKTREIVGTTDSTDTVRVKSDKIETDEIQSTEVQSETTQMTTEPETEDTIPVIKHTTLQTTESSTDNSQKTGLTTQTTIDQFYRVNSNYSYPLSDSYRNEETETSTEANENSINHIDNYYFESSTIDTDGSTTTKVQITNQTIDSQTKSGQGNTIINNTTDPSVIEEFEYEEYDEGSSLANFTEPNTQTTTEGAYYTDYYTDKITESKNIKTSQVKDYDDQIGATITAYTEIIATTKQETATVESTTQSAEKLKDDESYETNVDALDYNNIEFDINNRTQAGNISRVSDVSQNYDGITESGPLRKETTSIKKQPVGSARDTSTDTESSNDYAHVPNEVVSSRSEGDTFNSSENSQEYDKTTEPEALTTESETTSATEKLTDKSTRTLLPESLRVNPSGQPKPGVEQPTTELLRFTPKSGENVVINEETNTKVKSIKSVTEPSTETESSDEYANVPDEVVGSRRKGHTSYGSESSQDYYEITEPESQTTEPETTSTAEQPAHESITTLSPALSSSGQPRPSETETESSDHYAYVYDDIVDPRQKGDISYGSENSQEYDKITEPEPQTTEFKTTSAIEQPVHKPITTLSPKSSQLNSPGQPKPGGEQPITELLITTTKSGRELPLNQETTTESKSRESETQPSIKIESSDDYAHVPDEVVNSRQEGDTSYGSENSQEYEEITEPEPQTTESETTSATEPPVDKSSMTWSPKLPQSNPPRQPRPPGGEQTVSLRTTPKTGSDLALNQETTTESNSIESTTKSTTEIESSDDYDNVSDDIVYSKQGGDPSYGIENSQEYNEITKPEPQTTKSETTSAIEQPVDKSTTTLSQELSQPTPLGQAKLGGEQPTAELLRTTPKYGRDLALNQESTKESQSLESVTEPSTETESSDDYANVPDEVVNSRQEGDTSYGSENSQEYNENTEPEPQTTEFKTTSAAEQPVDKSSTTLSPKLLQSNPPGQPRPPGGEQTVSLRTTPKTGNDLALNQETTAESNSTQSTTKSTTETESSDDYVNIPDEVVDSRQKGDTFYDIENSQEYDDITETKPQTTESETTSTTEQPVNKLSTTWSPKLPGQPRPPGGEQTVSLRTTPKTGSDRVLNQETTTESNSIESTTKSTTETVSSDDYANVSDEVVDSKQERDTSYDSENSQKYNDITETEPQTTESETTNTTEQPVDKSRATLSPQLSQPTPPGQPTSNGEQPTETESSDDYDNVPDDIVDSRQEGDTSYGSGNSQEYNEITDPEPQITESATTSTTEQPVDKSTTALSPESSRPNPPGQPTSGGEHPTELLTPTTPKSGGKLALNQGKRDIMHALEANMNLKVLILPDSPAGKNCFCTCEADGPPFLIF